MVDRIGEVMQAVPRRGFLPPEQQSSADLDAALAIGHGSTCSQPSTVVRLLQLLDPRPGQRVLDVGSGSGWTTAMLAALVDPDGSVVGTEIEPALVERGRANLTAHDVRCAVIEQAVDGVLGWPAQAPYDRILVSAAAPSLPPSLLDQLADGGRLVMPVAGRLVTAVRSGTDVRTTQEGWYRFVPLREG